MTVEQTEPLGPLRRRAGRRAGLVAAGAATLLALGSAAGCAPRPAHDGSSPTPGTTRRGTAAAATSTPRSSGSPVVCAHVDKTDLTHAVYAGSHDPYHHANRLVAVAPDGTAYDARYGSSTIVRITADGSTTTVLGPLPGLGGGPTGIGVDRHHLVVAVPLSEGGGQRATSVFLVSRSTGVVLRIRTATARDRSTVLGPALLDGHVYWTEKDAGATAGRVRAYGLADGSTRTIGVNAVSAPLVSGGGLYWSGPHGLVTYRRGTLPHGFTPRPAAGYGAFVADGHSAAWLRYQDTEAQVVLQHGSSAPRVIADGRDLVGGGVDALSGPLLFWHDGSGHEFVFDARTDVVASHVLDDIVTAPPVAANGVLTLPGPNGGFALVRTAVITPLRC